MQRLIVARLVIIIGTGRANTSHKNSGDLEKMRAPRDLGLVVQPHGESLDGE
jgi:hypothetical protein